MSLPVLLAVSTPPCCRQRKSAPAALTSDELLGQRIPLTGPQSLTNSEMVDVIGSALGRPLRYNEIPVDLVRERFIALGFPPEFGDAYIAMLATTVNRPAEVTDNVERILGRPAQSWKQWVTEHKTLFSQGS